MSDGDVAHEEWAFHSRDGALRKGKRRQRKKGPVLHVQTLDFSEFLALFVKPAQFVFAKFDIEGSEYKVLNKMKDKGTTGLIDVMTIEWHCVKGIKCGPSWTQLKKGNVVDAATADFRRGLTSPIRVFDVDDESDLHDRAELSRVNAR